MSDTTFTVSARGRVTIDPDIDGALSVWRKMAAYNAIKGTPFNASYEAFCTWFDESWIYDAVCEKAADDLPFDIERGPDAAQIVPLAMFNGEPPTPEETGPKPTVGQLDVFGGEVPA